MLSGRQLCCTHSHPAVWLHIPRETRWLCLGVGWLAKSVTRVSHWGLSCFCTAVLQLVLTVRVYSLVADLDVAGVCPVPVLSVLGYQQDEGSAKRLLN